MSWEGRRTMEKVLENTVRDNPPRTRQYTLDRIATACFYTPPFPPAAPKSLELFWSTCQALLLNGVHQPVWQDWGLACPSIFLTHDTLHGLHKFFWDHMVRWALNIMKDDEFDHRLKVLQPRTGTRHWTHGVSKLKQVTGREHRELEKVFIAVIAGGVSDDTLQAMRALLEFIFHAQDLFLYDETVHALLHLEVASTVQCTTPKTKDGKDATKGACTTTW